MKQTAVQWLVEYIHSAEYQMAFGINYISPVVADKALEMEKEQMKHAYHDDRPSLSYFESGEAFEEYYNETYETQND